MDHPATLSGPGHRTPVALGPVGGCLGATGAGDLLDAGHATGPTPHRGARRSPSPLAARAAGAAPPAELCVRHHGPNGLDSGRAHRVAAQARTPTVRGRPATGHPSLPSPAVDGGGRRRLRAPPSPAGRYHPPRLQRRPVAGRIYLVARDSSAPESVGSRGPHGRPRGPTLPGRRRRRRHRGSGITMGGHHLVPVSYPRRS